MATNQAKASAAPKAAPAAAAPKVVKGAPGKKYQYVTVKQNGKTKRVLMEASKVAAIKRKREVGETTKLIPTQYRSTVDAGSINDAVASHINMLNAPLEQVKSDANTQFGTNVRMNDSLAAQTQASLDQLLANANARTQGFQQLAGQGIAAQQQTNREAAQATANALGAALNPQVASMVDAQLAPMLAQQHAGGVQRVWADTLASGAQKDFFERGKGIAAITQQAFNEGQRKKLAQSLDAIARQQAANQQQKAALVRQFAQEDYTLQGTIGAEMAKSQAEMDANEIAKYNAVTGRIKANKTGANAAATGQTKGIAAARKAVETKLAKTKKLVTVTKPVLDANGQPKVDSNGKPITTTVSAKQSIAEVFGANNGPWREAFKLLIDPTVGLDADSAAQLASQWYPNSIKGHDTAAIKQMLLTRGVSEKVTNQLLRGTKAPVQGPPAPVKPNTPRPKPPKAAAAAAKQVSGLYRQRMYQVGSTHYKVIGVSAAPNGKLQWSISITEGGKPGGRDTMVETKIGQLPAFVKKGVRIFA